MGWRPRTEVDAFEGEAAFEEVARLGDDGGFERRVRREPVDKPPRAEEAGDVAIQVLGLVIRVTRLPGVEGVGLVEQWLDAGADGVELRTRSE